MRKTKAFLSEEGGAAQAVTEGAAREQLRFRVNLMCILSIWKTPSVLPQGGNLAFSERKALFSLYFCGGEQGELIAVEGQQPLRLQTAEFGG